MDSYERKCRRAAEALKMFRAGSRKAEIGRSWGLGRSYVGQIIDHGIRLEMKTAGTLCVPGEWDAAVRSANTAHREARKTRVALPMTDDDLAATMIGKDGIAMLKKAGLVISRAPS